MNFTTICLAFLPIFLLENQVSHPLFPRDAFQSLHSVPIIEFVRTMLLAGRGGIAPTRLGLNRVPGNPPRSYPFCDHILLIVHDSMYRSRPGLQVPNANSVDCFKFRVRSFRFRVHLSFGASIASAGSFYALRSENIEGQTKFF